MWKKLLLRKVKAVLVVVYYFFDNLNLQLFWINAVHTHTYFFSLSPFLLSLSLSLEKRHHIFKACSKGTCISTSTSTSIIINVCTSVCKSEERWEKTNSKVPVCRLDSGEDSPVREGGSSSSSSSSSYERTNERASFSPRLTYSLTLKHMWFGLASYSQLVIAIHIA